MNNAPPARDNVSKGAAIAMCVIVLTLLLVALYANWQKFCRDKIESVTVTHFTPAPSASASPRP